jgi:AcrR family transcriptional regulator
MNTKTTTVDKIITASINLFYKNSYANTTLQDISKSSGAAIGSIYHAFPLGKSDIINTIAQRYFADYSKGMNRIMSTDLVNTTLEQIIDDELALFINLGQKYPCSYDPIFEDTQKVLFEEMATIESQMLSQIVLMIQIKIPSLTRAEAETKVKICIQIWDTLLSEYHKTQDEQILKELKIAVLKYLES